MLAHELRNPIAPIRYAAARLRAQGQADAGAPRVGRKRHRSAGRSLTRLIDDLLDVSRITRGKVSLAPRAGRGRRRSWRAPSKRRGH